MWSVALSCPTLCDPIDSDPPGSSAARFFSLWNFPGKNTVVGCLSFSRGSSQPGDWTVVACVSCTDGRILYHSHHLGSPPWPVEPKTPRGPLSHLQFNKTPSEASYIWDPPLCSLALVCFWKIRIFFFFCCYKCFTKLYVHISIEKKLIKCASSSWKDRCTENAFFLEADHSRFRSLNWTWGFHLATGFLSCNLSALVNKLSISFSLSYLVFS